MKRRYLKRKPKIFTLKLRRGNVSLMVKNNPIGRKFLKWQEAMEALKIKPYLK